MARLEQVLVNGEALALGSGLEGRIASAVERSGATSCVVVQVQLDQKSYSFAFPSGCAGIAGGSGSGSLPPELARLDKVYRSALQNLETTRAAIRESVIEFIKHL